MARTGSPNLNLGLHDQGDNPGAGSKTVDNDGVNGTLLKIDTALGTGHDAAGAHKANVIGTTQLQANAVTTVKITDANVTAAKLATDSVTTVKILDANVTTAKIADGAVTTVKILDANVTTAKIADDAVTTEKLEYQEYVAILTQSGASNPTVTVIKNTLSAAIVWTRTTTGVYQGVLSSAFTLNKTIGIAVNQSGTYKEPQVFRVDASTMQLNTYTNAGTSLSDGSTTAVVIRVYP